MFSLPQQIYTVVSDGPGFLVKLSPPIINSMAADTTRHLHSSLTLQDCSHGLWGLVRLTDLVTWWFKPALCNLFCNKLKIVSRPFLLLYFHTLWDMMDGFIHWLNMIYVMILTIKTCDFTSSLAFWIENTFPSLPETTNINVMCSKLNLPLWRLNGCTKIVT